MSASARNEGSNSVIVRVKRGRDQLAPDTICIMDDDSMKKKKKVSMNDLTTAGDDENSTKRRKKNYVVLRRVETVSQKDSGILDTETLQCLNKSVLPTNVDDVGSSSSSAGANAVPQTNPSSTSNGPSTPSKATAVFVNKGTKKMKSDDYEDVFVVDMVQQRAGDAPATPSGSSSGAVANKIFSPISRQLDSAIGSAYKSGDFSTISSLIEQGADVNYQRTKSDGLTCLMVAAYHGNSKMLAKLLAKNASISMGDANGCSALDYVKRNLSNHSTTADVATASKQRRSSGRMGAAMECSLLLHNAITVQEMKTDAATAGGTNPAAPKQKRMTKSSRSTPNVAAISAAEAAAVEATKRAAAAAAGVDSMDQEGDDCVYDVYCVQQPVLRQAQQADGLELLPPLGSETHGSDENGGAEGVDTCFDPSLELEHGTHVMQVPGLHIDNYGQLITFTDEAEQQHFVYDSDWSDLGDDEDPDSNDERFGGNDYPEDEVDEEEVEALREQARERAIREKAYRQKHKVNSSNAGLQSNAKPTGPFAPTPNPNHSSYMFGAQDAADDDSDSNSDSNERNIDGDDDGDFGAQGGFVDDEDEFDCTDDYNAYIQSAYEDDDDGDGDGGLGSDMPRFERSGSQTGRVQRPMLVSFPDSGGGDDMAADDMAVDDESDS